MTPLTSTTSCPPRRIAISSGNTTGVRTPLSRGRILQAAILLVEERGLRELSMRSLARELDVEAMALYRYVPSREDLLDGVVDTVLDGLYADPEVQLVPDHSWQEYLVRLAHGVRTMALAHPQVFPLIATRPPAAPWLQPPLRSLRWVDTLLQGLLGAGFSHVDAVHAYRAFSSFLLGHLLLEVGAMGVDTGPIDEPDKPAASSSPGRIEDSALRQYPLLVDLAPELAKFRFAEEFDESLHNLLERLGPGAGPASA